MRKYITLILLYLIGVLLIPEIVFSYFSKLDESKLEAKSLENVVIDNHTYKIIIVKDSDRKEYKLVHDPECETKDIVNKLDSVAISRD
jgi:hypothetical protein